MRCVICKGSELTRKTIDEEIRTGCDILLVPLAVLVCADCGERYYDRAAMRIIESSRERMNRNDLPVEQVGRVLRPQVA